jgi:magnesium-transporting ATPase (P-type)
VTPLLRVAALCNDARVEQRGGRWRSTGDPTEGALLILARKGGIERARNAAPTVCASSRSSRPVSG